MSAFGFDDFDELDELDLDELSDEEWLVLFDGAPEEDEPARRRITDVPISIDDYPPAPHHPTQE